MFTHAVIMGDLVDSERSRSTSRLHAFFNKEVETINAHYRRAIVSPLTITLGDEFQGLVRSLKQALDMAHDMRMALLADETPCRFVVGLVSIKTPVNRRTAWNMMGPGLAAAREKLDAKDEANAMRFSLPGRPVQERVLDAIGAAITNLQDGWTPRQLEVVRELDAIDGTIGDLIRKMKIAPNTFHKIRRAARIELHDQLWEALATAAADLDSTEGLPP